MLYSSYLQGCHDTLNALEKIAQNNKSILKDLLPSMTAFTSGFQLESELQDIPLDSDSYPDPNKVYQYQLGIHDTIYNFLDNLYWINLDSLEDITRLLRHLRKQISNLTSFGEGLTELSKRIHQKAFTPDVSDDDMVSAFLQKHLKLLQEVDDFFPEEPIQSPNDPEFLLLQEKVTDILEREAYQAETYFTQEVADLDLTPNEKNILLEIHRSYFKVKRQTILEKLKGIGQR